VESRAAQGDAFGAFLKTRVAGGAEVDDVVHVVLCVRQVLCWFKNYCLLVPLKKLGSVPISFGINFPFVEAGAAQSHTFGAFLQTRVADGAEVDDVAVHWFCFLSEQICFRKYCEADPFNYLY